MKKSIWRVLLSIFILSMLIPTIHAAEIIDSGTCGKEGGDNLTWVLDSEGTLTISGEGEMGHLPWGYYGTPTDYRPFINNVIIGDGVSNIYLGAFSGCENIKSVTLPNTLTTIEDMAFNNCRSLTSITLPESLVSIAEMAFANSQLKSVQIPCNVEEIGDGAFYGNDGCVITVDPDNKFYSSLDGVLFDKDKTKLIAYTMDGENAPEKIYVVPEGVKTIGVSAFCNCSNLWGVVLPQSLINIESCAFDCANLVWDLTIPKNVESISADAFTNSGTKNFIVDEENKKFCSVDGVLFNKEKTELLAYPDWKQDIVYTIPDGTITIGDYAFYASGNAVRICIPDSVVHIGKMSFANMRKLDTIEIPDSVIDIGREAFLYNKSLRNVSLGNGISDIKSRTFEGCKSLESVFISQNAVKIDYAGFDECKNLAYVYYGGSEEEWHSIAVDECNDYLLNAEIFYNVIGNDPPKITQINAKNNNDSTYEVDISLESVNRVEYLVVASYNQETLVGIENIRLVPNDTEKSIAINDSSVDLVKAFIWDSFNGMKPLCDAKTLSISQ